ncbi:MAG TPA: hypothetical protein VF510_06415 [Ktedonobacterales bacterium]
MNGKLSQQRVAALATISAGLLQIGSAALLYAALDNGSGNLLSTFDFFRHPDTLITLRATHTLLLRWGFILDIFGSYLLFAPVALFLRAWLRHLSPDHIELFTISGLAYMLVGAIGAAVLTAVAPPLIAAYATASSTERAISAAVLASFVNAVYIGLWNILEATLAAIWWLGIGFALQRVRPVLGFLTILVGICWLVDAAAHMLDIEGISLVALCALFSLLPIWAIWLGLDLLRRPLLASHTIQSPVMEYQTDR